MTERSNGDWLRELGAGGEDQAAALGDLRAYLLRAARYALYRRWGRLAHRAPADLDQMAEDCAQEALLAILARLETFRGDSRSMTVPDGQGTSMTPRPLDRLLRQISATETEEISCSECFDFLASGVELELAGAPSTPPQARLAQHLGQCAVCREEYGVLREFLQSTPAHPGPAAGARPAAPPDPAP